MREPKNEAAICRHIRNFYEKRYSLDAQHQAKPDLDSSKRNVDSRFSIGDTTFFLEHTQIEPFEFEKRFTALAKKLFCPILHEVRRHLLPTGQFACSFPVDPSVKPSQIAQAQAEIAQWIRTSAAEMEAEAPEPDALGRDANWTFQRREKEIYGLHITLTRNYHPDLLSDYDRIIGFLRRPPGELKERLGKRIERAISDKLPKVLEYKSEGNHTALILENQDIQLTNHIKTTRTARATLKKYPEIPDDVFYVETGIETCWSFYYIIYSGKSVDSYDEIFQVGSSGTVYR